MKKPQQQISAKNEKSLPSSPNTLKATWGEHSYAEDYVRGTAHKLGTRMQVNATTEGGSHEFSQHPEGDSGRTFDCTCA